MKWLLSELLTSILFCSMAVAQQPATNLALVAQASTSFVSGHETITALNDGFDPRHSDDKSHGAYGNWPRSGTQWVQYDWSQPVFINRVDVYWFDDARGVRLPKACRLQYWDGSQFVDVPDARSLGLVKNTFNSTTFAEVKTTRLRLEMDSDGTFSTGLLEWRVYDSGKSPNFAPIVEAGIDRVLVMPGRTYLSGIIRDDRKSNPTPAARWSRDSGPGEVSFQDAAAPVTTATFSAPGDYILRLTADDGQLSASSTLAVKVTSPPPPRPLSVVHTGPYRLNSPFWDARIKALIVNWIPHCYNMMTDLSVKEGGIDNFVQAGNKLAGRPHTGHTGAVFANAWVHNTVESMCIALMIDPQGDGQLIAAQKAIKITLDDWIPKILSAQEPDGYLQTFYTLNNVRRWTNKHDHEDYLAGYFIEASLAHFQMTGRADRRMYDAARRLADCFDRNVGPQSGRKWYGGHQELEQALVRLARVVDEVEGPGAGRRYVELAKYTMDCRQGGDEYDQSHLPVTRQYEAVGHAVRAVYSYSGMADIAMQTGDIDYHSAVRSLWDNIVNKKYYVTGGVGSGETSEGFGRNYSLPNNAYCESCAGCGELFFQHKMHLIWQDAKFADLYEETIYNAILGGIDLEGRNFTYTNPLDSGHARYKWHVCPCCVGNIPRTLMMLPTWMYSRSADSLYVNLFVGSTINVGQVAGTDVQVVQATDYPWHGKVAITVNPAQEKSFSLHIRVPDRSVSNLYTSSPDSDGISSITLNDQTISPSIEKGYAVLTRTWKAGDTVTLELPLRPQRVKCIDKVSANVGRVALRYGPLIYNIESVDQNIELVLGPDSPLAVEWRQDLLGGVMAITGRFTNGSPMLSIPNYARNNRGGRAIVWMKDR